MNIFPNTKARQDAVDFLMSPRGQYIMAQALHYGVRSLEDELYKEESNIADMKYLQDELYAGFSWCFDAVPQR